MRQKHKNTIRSGGVLRSHPHGALETLVRELRAASHSGPGHRERHPRVSGGQGGRDSPPPGTGKHAHWVPSTWAHVLPARMRRAHPTPRLRLCARPCFRHARYGGGGVHPWPRLLGRCAGHLTRLRAEETQGKSRSTPSGPPPPKAAGPSSSPPAPSFARHAVGEDLQAAPHLRWVPRQARGWRGRPGPGKLRGRGGGPGWGPGG